MPNDRIDPTDRAPELVSALVDLACGPATGTDMPELLHRLVANCVQLFSATSAALLLANEAGVPTVAAASSSDREHLDLFQLQVAEGPCLDCVATGGYVVVDDLSASAGRWSTWAPRALAGGVCSVYAFPLRLGTQTFGALNLLGDGPAMMGADDRSAATALADVSAAVVATDRQARRAEQLTGQLQHALDSRVVIEQAKGVTSVALGVSVDEAFHVLRGYSRSRNRRLTDIATDLTTGRLDARELVQLRPAGSRPSVRSGTPA